MTITEEHIGSLSADELRALALRIVDDAATALTTELDGELGVDAAPARTAADYLRGMLSEPDTGDEPGSFDEVAYRSYSDALTDFGNDVSEAGKSSVADPAEFLPGLNSQALLSVLGSIACFGDNDVTDRRPDHRRLHEALFRYGQGFLPPYVSGGDYIVRVVCPDDDSDDSRLGILVNSYLTYGYFDTFAEAIAEAKETLQEMPLESLADLSRRDLLGLVRQITYDAEACYNADYFGYTADVLHEAVDGIEKTLADYPDVDSEPVLEAADYAFELLDCFDLAIYGYDSGEYHKHSGVVYDFVSLAYDLGCWDGVDDESDVDESDDGGEAQDPSQFPLFRNALALQQLYDAIEPLSIFGQCVDYLRYIADGRDVDEDVCYNLSEDMDACVRETHGEDRRGAIYAVTAVDCCLAMFSRRSGADDEYYPRRWDWRMFTTAVRCAADTRNETPLRYAIKYVLKVTPDCTSDDPRLVDLVEKRIDGGWGDWTIVNAISFAQHKLASEEAS